VQPLRILLADDHAAVRRGARAILESEPQWVVCCEAANGREAVEQVLEHEPDVVLLDVAMPEMNGLQAAREILRQSPRARVFLLTTHQSEELQTEALRAGLQGVILKSDADMLTAALQMAERQFVHLAGSIVNRIRHIGAFFASDVERYDVLAPFVAEGLTAGERAVHIVDRVDHDTHMQRLAHPGIDVSLAAEESQFQLLPWDAMYLYDGHFDQRAMVERIQNVLGDQSTKDFPKTRLVAHMEWALEPRPGVHDLVEYESRLNHVLPKFDDVVICAYDLTRFDGRVIMDVMRAHPAVVIGGSFFENPLYVPPGAFSGVARH
jgi:DNA-binding NarL/FixJ family response regulator